MLPRAPIEGQRQQVLLLHIPASIYGIRYIPFDINACAPAIAAAVILPPHLQYTVAWLSKANTQKSWHSSNIFPFLKGELDISVRLHSGHTGG